MELKDFIAINSSKETLINFIDEMTDYDKERVESFINEFDEEEMENLIIDELYYKDNKTLNIRFNNGRKMTWF